MTDPWGRCPECDTPLQRSWLNFDSQIIVCPSESCLYPLDSSEISHMVTSSHSTSTASTALSSSLTASSQAVRLLQRAPRRADPMLARFALPDKPSGASRSPASSPVVTPAGSPVSRPSLTAPASPATTATSTTSSLAFPSAKPSQLGSASRLGHSAAAQAGAAVQSRTQPRSQPAPDW